MLKTNKEKIKKINERILLDKKVIKIPTLYQEDFYDLDFKNLIVYKNDYSLETDLNNLIYGGDHLSSNKCLEKVRRKLLKVKA